MKTHPQQKPVTLEEIWHILRETTKEREKAAREQAKAEKERAKAAKERAKEQAKAARQRVKAEKETRELKKLFKETDRQMKESGKRIDKIHALFNSQWSKLVESLVEGKLVELLQSRGIHVYETYTRIQRSYKDEKGELQRREIDIIAANGEEVVVVEVKTTLKPDNVKYFMETLKIFKRYFSLYANKTVYGAVAYLRSDSEASLFAERKGLFVIRATGDSASLINKPDFKPKAF